MKSHRIDVWGDLACFSRPEMKVERYSYPCMTPSAARGVFDAIYVKPGSFRWQIDQIVLRREPSYLALRRNEVKDTISVRAVRRWMEGKSEPEPLWADGDRSFLGTDEKGRTQRQTMALRRPSYRIVAHIEPWPGHEDGVAAFDAQFVRRAKSGKCFSQPYLGCREFPAYFELSDADSRAAQFDLNVGLMLYDVFDLSKPGTGADSAAISVFQARIEGGVLQVPHWNDPSVLKAGGVA